MNSIFKWFVSGLSCLIFLTTLSIESFAENMGLQLAKQAEVANDGFAGEKAEMQMILINAYGDKVERKMSSQTMETSGDGDKSIVTFLWPADVKGTKMLTWTHKSKDNDQWLYLSAMKKVKRISSRSKTGSFMGSEFSYEDLGSQEVEKYTYKYLKDEDLKGRKASVYERYPTEKDSGYSKQIVWQDQQYLNPLKVEYYDRKGELLKTAKFSGYKKIKKWWRSSSIEMVNHQTKKSSVLKWENRTLGHKFSARAFNKKSMIE